MPGIEGSMSKIRDFINIPQKQDVLMQDSVKWNILCSCMDTIEDTDLALEAYEKASDIGDIGYIYLLIYGTQQTLIVQQDAVKNLYYAFDERFNETELFKEIRNIRNFSTGHPTKRDHPKELKGACAFLGRGLLRKEHYSMITFIPEIDGIRQERKDVNLTDLVYKQRIAIEEKLLELLDILKSTKTELS